MDQVNNPAQIQQPVIVPPVMQMPAAPQAPVINSSTNQETSGWDDSAKVAIILNIVGYVYILSIFILSKVGFQAFLSSTFFLWIANVMSFVLSFKNVTVIFFPFYLILKRPQGTLQVLSIYFLVAYGVGVTFPGNPIILGIIFFGFLYLLKSRGDNEIYKIVGVSGLIATSYELIMHFLTVYL